MLFENFDVFGTNFAIGDETVNESVAEAKWSNKAFFLNIKYKIISKIDWEYLFK